MSEPLPLHEALQEHLDHCATCNAEMQRQKKSPRGFGQKAQFCQVYQLIVQQDAQPQYRSMHDS